MNRNTFIGLLIAALLALLAAVVIHYGNQPEREAAQRDALLAPGLGEHLNDVGSVVIKGAGNKTLATLVRGDKDWTLAEKGGYPVDGGKLRELLLKLADARLVEPKTANKDKYAVLGVQDIGASDAKGVELDLKGLAQPLQLIIGDANPHGGTYVRRVGDAQSWLTLAALGVDKNPVNWLHKDLLSIPASRIASVSLGRTDGAGVRLAKKAQGDADFSLLDVPAGREAGDAYTINGIAGTLDGLRLDDVLASSGVKVPADARNAQFETSDGLVFVLTNWSSDGKHYAQIGVRLDAAKANAGIDAAQGKVKAEYAKALADAEKGGSKEGKDMPIKPLAETDAGKDRVNRLAALNEEVARLEARLHGWTFVLPAYKAANLDKSISELLKPAEVKPTKTKARGK